MTKKLSDADIDIIGATIGVPNDDDWRRIWCRETRLCVLIDWLRHALKQEQESDS